MPHQTNDVLTFYIWFLSKLEKGNKMFYFIESHYNDLCTTPLIVLDCTFFKLVTNPLQKLKNGPLYSGHPKLSKFVRFLYMEI